MAPPKGELSRRPRRPALIELTGRISVHFLFARAKRKWTKRESTPGEGISISPPLDPFLETTKEETSPLL